MTNPVSMELHHEIEQFYYRESAMLDDEQFRDWLGNVVDPAIRYQVLSSQERTRRDLEKTSAADTEVPIFDEDINMLGLRIAQFETGLQRMQDPQQRIFRVISNVLASHGEQAGEYVVRSIGTVSRFRNQYENERTVYRRTDVLKRGESGELRVLSRRIDLGERVIRNKNLLFFM